ncbi:hypothetical protein [Pseudomonas sp. QD4]|uniref:hypothetical protein n=1 Tax=Pseudomonas sp. QD4 TaxID=3368618 RepID=UPI003B9E7D2B
MITEISTEEQSIYETVGGTRRYYVSEAGVYLGSTDDAPLSEFEVPDGPGRADQPWQFPGWGNSPSALRDIENEWREAEMPHARENVTAIEFGDDSIPGTSAQWKAYWLALRAWTEGAEGYPDATHRPLKPT